MTETTPVAGRDARGRFQPGQSGNPAGKPPGTLNHATRLKGLLADEAYDRIARKVVEAATEGHWPSVRFVMERLVPKPRGREIALDLPPGASRAARLTALVDLMCAGEISADEAKAMIAVIDDGDRATRQPVRRAPQEPAAAPAPVAGVEPPALPPDLQSACIPERASPGLRSRLLQSTCISTSGMPGLDPAALAAEAAAAVAARAVATPPARRAA